MRTYKELICIPSFFDRFDYLKLDGNVGEETFGYDRWINQQLYGCYEWKKVRAAVAMRDKGYDLAHEDFPIHGKILIHHLNPLTKAQIVNRDPRVFDLNNLVSVSVRTHNAIHYGDKNLLAHPPITRRPNDTALWK